MTDTTFSRAFAEQKQRIERARGPFERLCLGLLSIGRYRGKLGGSDELPVYRRLREALWALREWRDANNQARNMGDGEIVLSIRVVADELAREIAAAATPEQDRATIAWVLAGMRCPSRPFCNGCRACQTIESPLRPTGEGPL